MIEIADITIGGREVKKVTMNGQQVWPPLRTYVLQNVHIAYSDGQTVLKADGSNYAVILADVHVYQHGHRVRILYDVILTPAFTTATQNFYITDVRIFGKDRDLTTGNARSIQVYGRYETVTTSNLTVTQERNAGYHDYTYTTTMGIGYIGTIPSEGASVRVNYSVLRHDHFYTTANPTGTNTTENRTATPACNVETTLPASISGTGSFTAAVPQNTTGAARTVTFSLTSQDGQTASDSKQQAYTPVVVLQMRFSPDLGISGTLLNKIQLAGVVLSGTLETDVTITNLHIIFWNDEQKTSKQSEITLLDTFTMNRRFLTLNTGMSMFSPAWVEIDFDTDVEMQKTVDFKLLTPR